MAEFVMKELARQAGWTSLRVDSAALHTDELGSDIHPGTRRLLRQHGIPFTPRKAWLLTPREAQAYDLLVGMDEANRGDLRRLLPLPLHPRIHLLLDWSPRPRDIADPWYTDNFEQTYQDVLQGCQSLLEALHRTPPPESHL